LLFYVSFFFFFFFLNCLDVLLHYVINKTPVGARKDIVEQLVKEKKVDINVPGRNKRTGMNSLDMYR
jgi:hypothetical protein